MFSGRPTAAGAAAAAAAAASAAPSGGAGVSAAQATQVVLSVLAAKTGYEPDMIEMDMALETELGVDSIKRVEILSDVQKELSVEAQDVAALSRTQTVGEVVEAMIAELRSQGLSGGGGGGGASVAVAVDPTPSTSSRVSPLNSHASSFSDLTSAAMPVSAPAAPTPAPKPSGPVDQRIAVVGIGVHYAGAASLDEFWKLLNENRSGCDSVSRTSCTLLSAHAHTHALYTPAHFQTLPSFRCPGESEAALRRRHLEPPERAGQADGR